MRFMMMMQAPRGTGDWNPLSWPPADLKAHIDFMHNFNRQLVAEGAFVNAEGLAPPRDARVVRATKTGVPAVTDGPYPEGKEFLAGYWIVDCETPEQAYAMAARASAAPGPGGRPLNIAIEVRQVMGAPPTN